MSKTLFILLSSWPCVVTKAEQANWTVQHIVQHEHSVIVGNSKQIRHRTPPDKGKRHTVTAFT